MGRSAVGSLSFERRRGEIETYFDRTAAAAWARLTSTEPLSGIRATVRAGRDRMRATLLSYLPAELAGRRLLDAGSGTGALAVAAAARGAAVTAIDLSATLMDLARSRAGNPERGSLDFRVGDMTDAALGRFDHVVAMDSLIHYALADVVRSLASFAPRTSGSIVFTIAPATLLLRVMHGAGKLFPRADRSPAIVPIAPARLRRAIAAEPALAGWRVGRSERISSSFYISQAIELVPVR